MPQYDSDFYDFYSYPDSPNSISNLAAEAKRYGFSGIVVIDPKINKETLLPDDFSIYKGVEIQAKSSRIREEIRKYRETNYILIVKGGDEEVNRAAVESEGMDILLQPSEINNVIAKTASDNSIAIGFDLGLLIRFRGDARVRELKNMRINLKHARKYELPMILTCHSNSVYDLRSPREMVALSGLFGMTPKEAIDAMSATPLGILRRKSPDYIQEGIEII